MVPFFLFATVIKVASQRWSDFEVQLNIVKGFCLSTEGINALQVTHIWGNKERGFCSTADVFIWLLTKGWVTQKFKPREEQKYFQT